MILRFPLPSELIERITYGGKQWRNADQFCNWSYSLYAELSCHDRSLLIICSADAYAQILMVKREELVCPGNVSEPAESLRLNMYFDVKELHIQASRLLYDALNEPSKLQCITEGRTTMLVS